MDKGIYIARPGDMVSFGKKKDLHIGVVKEWKDTGCLFSALLKPDGKLVLNKWKKKIKNIRIASEGEKYVFHRAILKNNIQYDPRTMSFQEYKRWFAKDGETFFYLDNKFKAWKAEMSALGEREIRDAWIIGNHFKTKEAAQKVGNEICNLLRNSKEE